ncbi:MAG: hypothetical protein WD512_00765 [Candidatus Paceibacterota bacterium]
MRTIGTDAGLDVCKQEGYMMVQYDARKKFDPDMEYRAFCYYPQFQIPTDDLRTDEMVSFNRLKEIYLEDKKSIDSFAQTHKFVNFDNPDYYDFLNLASDVIGYKGNI